MSNQEANGDYQKEELPQGHTYKVTSFGDGSSSTVNVYDPSSTNLGYTFTNSYPLTASFPFTTTTSTASTYPSWGGSIFGDERKTIPDVCRCDAPMGSPSEEHVYIRKVWFCSIKCYEEWIFACIAKRDIDE